ncbi:nuclease A inhibitor-like protein [Pontibacter mucosus]|uniref:Nuclease A inhibitor-like protein n=1 Tax=Pontibacter mucosus TaxID=1649266 RepID=A0A2T5YLJ4_9BACT|nr:nuclease A inhibitor family protein [Pontibacter mucosus]PTX20186.1 nuclease A inhibitor-like protein [Pontibacter mucosus]
MSKEELQKELMQAADGILLRSEIESPLEFVYLETEQGRQLTPEDVVEYAGKPSGMAVKAYDLEGFMQLLQGITSDARKGPDSATRQLFGTLQRLLQDVKVYTITQIGTEAYILGRAEDGNYAGYKSMVVLDESSIEERDES